MTLYPLPSLSKRQILMSNPHSESTPKFCSYPYRHTHTLHVPLSLSRSSRGCPPPILGLLRDSVHTYTIIHISYTSYTSLTRPSLSPQIISWMSTPKSKSYFHQYITPGFEASPTFVGSGISSAPPSLNLTPTSACAPADAAKGLAWEDRFWGAPRRSAGGGHFLADDSDGEQQSTRTDTPEYVSELVLLVRRLANEKALWACVSFTRLTNMEDETMVNAMHDRSLVAAAPFSSTVKRR